MEATRQKWRPRVEVKVEVEGTRDLASAIDLLLFTRALKLTDGFWSRQGRKQRTKVRKDEGSFLGKEKRVQSERKSYSNMEEREGEGECGLMNLITKIGFLRRNGQKFSHKHLLN